MSWGGDGNGSSLNTSRFTITVAGLHVDGFAFSFSNHGASILLAAPANEIVTTDLLGIDGYWGFASPGGDYNNNFYSTSAAAAIVSGVVALMLDANPLLGWRDVQNILAASSKHTGSIIGPGANENGVWFWNKADDWNGGGMHVHTNYGYGHVNAYNAVRMAEVWSLFGAAKTSANEVAVPVTFGGLPQNLLDNALFTYAPALSGFDPNFTTDHISVRLNLTHSDWTQLRISIVSPEGTEIVLADGTSGSATTSDLPLDWTFGIEGLRGERINGTWTLKINDVVAGATGTLNGWSMNFYGSAPDFVDVYTYTDEYVYLLSDPANAARRTLTDTDWGIDWINGAAVTTNQWLDLRGGTAFPTMTGGDFATLIGTFENAIGSDGADTVYGNYLNNVMLGMRGADRLYGEGGNDTIGTGFGTPGGDTVDGGTGFDFLDYRGSPVPIGVGINPGATGVGWWYGGPAGPTYVDTLNAIEGAFGSAFGDYLLAQGSGADFWGLEGADSLWGAGSAVLRGGRGNDLYSVTATDVVVEAAGEGNDTVRSAVSFALTGGAAIEVLETTDALGVAAINLTGSAFGQTIHGNAGLNVLNGGGGRDVFHGYGGADTIIGGNGGDLLYGGTGNDRLVGGDGNDLFYVNFTNVLNGEDGDDTAIGGAAADYLDGGTGLRDLLWYAGLLSVQVALDLWDPLESTCRHASLSIL